MLHTEHHHHHHAHRAQTSPPPSSAQLVTADGPTPNPLSPLPTHTFHPPSLLPHSIPTPALFDSLAGGAHYSGVDPVKERHLSIHRANSHGVRSDPRRRSSLLINARDKHRAVLDDLKELYEGRPTKLIMTKRWRKDAEFEDSSVKCKGIHEIAAQVPLTSFAQPRVVSKSTIVSRRIMSSTEAPNRLIYWQRHEYVSRFTGMKKSVESIITVDLDEDETIIRLVQQTEGKDVPTRWGAQHFRRLHGRIVPWLPWISSSPKEKNNHH
ncbi:hypothetical protein FA95DRAFT_1488021 [Auriscalpium vulgare]|uniref:Uncharacterized protein n=1 Tax=Auriscalpium vulgare TaxID=40419 RepID=A0ACB8S1N3_9AGAM|nr:hypothetical protein FA95DRAFT_1488021 [Auriscalpium vulgare]